jgi:hypothetical protein
VGFSFQCFMRRGFFCLIFYSFLYPKESFRSFFFVYIHVEKLYMKRFYILSLFVVVLSGLSTSLKAQVNVQINPFPPVYVNPPVYGYPPAGAYMNPYMPGPYIPYPRPGIYISPGPRFFGYGSPYRHYGYGRPWSYGYYGRGWDGYRGHHHHG